MQDLRAWWDSLTIDEKNFYINTASGVVTALILAAALIFRDSLLALVRRIFSHTIQPPAPQQVVIEVRTSSEPTTESRKPTYVGTVKSAKPEIKSQRPASGAADSDITVQPASAHSTDAIEVFYSYSHKDEALRDELETHLAMLRREGIIRNWHDRRISAGREWAGKIDAHLNSAKIILLLISADFLASDYCFDLEVTRAMQRHEAGEARVIPVILRTCDWMSAPFGRLQALPKDAIPVKKWADQDEAFTDIAMGVRKAVIEIATHTRTEVCADQTKEDAELLGSGEHQPTNEMRTKLLALHQLEQEALIDQSIKQEYQRRLLDKWVDTE